VPGVRKVMINAARSVGTLREAGRVGNVKVLWHLLGPAVRGLLLQRGKNGPSTFVAADYDARFNWEYRREDVALKRLYTAAKQSQWDAARDLDWTIDVDPEDPSRPIVNEQLNPLKGVAAFERLPEAQRHHHRNAMLAWLLSQFLHGEQGALFAACQVTEAVTGLDGKLFGSTQVVDEGRHVEVFHRYLSEKLGRIYEINDNLFVVIDALMTDSRWDMKFLGMQIMVEGLALGAFSTLRQGAHDPLLKELLRYVIADEARHVHFGVLALGEYFAKLSSRELKEREDWAYELSLLLRNRFLAHEFYDEYYAHAMSRRDWEKAILASEFMQLFRRAMFRRIIPNLKRIHLLSDRIRPYYEALGLLAWEHEKAAPDLDAKDLVTDA
jgi:hypothetical protein